MQVTVVETFEIDEDFDYENVKLAHKFALDIESRINR